MIQYSFRLKGVHEDLQLLIKKASRIIPVRILEGVRPIAKQQHLIDTGRSKIKVAKLAPHVRRIAVDMVPLTKNLEFQGWGDNKDPKELGAFYSLHAILRVYSKELNIPIRVGSDWDMDWSFKDQTFDDLVHAELVL